MSTVDEMKEETETREMDDFERFVTHNTGVSRGGASQVVARDKSSAD
jgi:hypothetical protein